MKIFFLLALVLTLSKSMAPNSPYTPTSHIDRENAHAMAYLNYRLSGKLKIRNSTSGLEFAKSIERACAIAIGAIAPVFTQNDMNDQPVTLSDFRGKYVLVDFGHPGVVLAAWKPPM
ncbi:MAG: hypothetical protein JWR38_1687 [Mucilaginibacter sp.]|nr:hypothetical protein [Mucilaginibacter sp.]